MSATQTSPMLYALTLFACIAVMSVLFRRCCLYSGRVHINPMFGLLMGLAFYVLLPSTVIFYFADLIDAWTAYGAELTQKNAQTVMQFTLVLLAAVLLGVIAWRHTQPRAALRSVLTADAVLGLRLRWTAGASWPATFAMIGSILLFAALAFTIRDSLFAGYDEDVLGDDSIWAARGVMSSSYSMFYVSMCVFILRRRRYLGRFSKCALGAAFAISSLILLSMGARLYVTMALISLLALRSALSNGIPARQLALFLLGGAMLMGAVGVLRSSAYSGVGSVLRNVALEPLLTSISLYTLLTDNAPIWIGQVHMFFADFQAVIPSVIFPGKSGLFQRLETYGYKFEAPVGGYHLYFSGLINFGYIGMTLIALWVGYVLAQLSRRPAAGPMRTSSLVSGIYLSGALTFTVFRDPFFIAIAKNVLITAVILPFVLTGFNRRTATPTAKAPLTHPA